MFHSIWRFQHIPLQNSGQLRLGEICYKRHIFKNILIMNKVRVNQLTQCTPNQLFSNILVLTPHNLACCKFNMLVLNKYKIEGCNTLTVKSFIPFTVIFVCNNDEFGLFYRQFKVYFIDMYTMSMLWNGALPLVTSRSLTLRL